MRRDDTLLLVKRGKAPNMGQWAIPGGRVNWGESLKEAVAREIREETGVRIEVGELVYTFEFIDEEHHYVVLDFAAEYREGEVVAGDDASEAGWVAFDEMDVLELTVSTRRALALLFPDDFPAGARLQ